MSPPRSSVGTCHSLAVSKQLDERRRRLPIRRRVTNGRWVEIEEADKNFADDAGADGAKAIAAAADVGLALDVIPERRVTAPTGRRGADFLTR